MDRVDRLFRRPIEMWLHATGQVPERLIGARSTKVLPASGTPRKRRVWLTRSRYQPGDRARHDRIYQRRQDESFAFYAACQAMTRRIPRYRFLAS
jgi:hypothetical protein